MTNNSGTVAVIMSTYGADDPHLLRKALDSLIKQSLAEHERLHIYLGVDGRIPDDLKEVILSYQNHLYKLLFFQNNRGLAHVLNDLLSELEDEQLIFRMDSDDFSHPTRFSKQIKFMAQNPHIDILGTAIIEKSKGHPLRAVKFPVDHESATNAMFWRTPVAHPTVCIRRKVFEHLGGYPTDSLNEDIALWFRASKAGFRFSNLSEPLLDFTIGEGFWQRRGVAKAWGEFKCYVKGIYITDGLSWKFIAPLARLFFRLGPKSLKKLGYSIRAK